MLCEATTAAGTPCKNHAKHGGKFCGTHDKATPTGRPTEYTPKHPMYAATMCRLGATDEDLAQAFGVTTTTVDNWKREYPEFLAALGETKALANTDVAASLFKKATGYSYEEVKVESTTHVASPTDSVEVRLAHLDAMQNEMALQDVKITRTTKHVPASEAAIAIWLYNRDRDNWRDSRHLSHSLDEETVGWLQAMNGLADARKDG